MEFCNGKGMLLMMLVVMVGCLSSIESFTFYVGGRDGWRTDPSENYIHWAERHRFQINDTLVFSYNKGEDSVLVVNKEDYFKCQKSAPVLTLNEGESGSSHFTFDRPGFFFFISGRDNNCEKGQKIIVLVVHPRHTKPPSSPSPLAPASSPPAPVLLTPSPLAPASPPVSLTPSPSPMDAPTTLSPPSPPTAAVSPAGWGLAPGPAPASNSAVSMACSFGLSSALVMAVAFVVSY